MRSHFFILMQIKLIVTRKVCTWPLFESENFSNWEMAYFMHVVSYHASESTIVVVFVLKKQELSDTWLYWVIYESTNALMGI